MTLSRQIAVRIGLAARALPDAGPEAILAMLARTTGLPPTEDRLSALKVRDLAALSEAAGIHQLKEALACLKGEHDADGPPAAPEPEAYAEGEIPGSVRVACASNGAEDLDGHFGSCARFLVYQVSAAEARLVDVRPVGTSPPGIDKNDYRADLVADCDLLYVASIGGPPAAKVVRRGVHPVKVPQPTPAREAIGSLQAVLATAPPPFLAKAMGRWPGKAA